MALQRGVAGLEEEKAGRNRDLDPQLVWRGKAEQDWSDLVAFMPRRSTSREKSTPRR
ncbi:hypothetical protein [Candidatus Methylomirabilis sp.]|uniref:hypothetical protein n=1 Tax=Candidatus Methylomirabilis sp. TaxID=2032687 RepID=UPI0030767E04